ncbi:xylan alpha-1,2-glucuronidase [Anaerocolumna cellulosilytica]|uniref:Xylan alpha-1,2-glucuronidase n=1 Tax=Anaerocolumna cellulosilytica TaxID=433286 RepID=A0A6S6R4M4_9FIRM|nr:alpha-glucuronidase [Anaerocolumna cellulosilytica]MBB5194678.1 alpha-glucuronidase [Anaerocolumna cellulosilytica]BCJ94360.1 xylan alpha-1,2-glucuronidase [Anaerocolumna cellulosilytica]
MEYGKAWLNYRRIEEKSFCKYLTGIYSQVEDDKINSGIKELNIAFEGMYGIKIPFSRWETDSGIQLKISSDLSKEEYYIHPNGNVFLIEGGSSTGILYGIFQLLRMLMEETPAKDIAVRKAPDNPLRMLNHWDNMDGSIERGYAGESFFFQKNKVMVNERTRDYARLVASVGINGVVINNVNVKQEATRLITKEHLKELKKMEEIFAAFGIRLFLSLNFAAPMELGGMATADPLSPEVKVWWKEKLKEVYEHLPRLGGFLIKADSEGRPGPFTYNRTHADGANMLAEIIKPYNGIIIWRCFVYNCKQDWRDKKTDRARSGYDHFKPLDGAFLENVILQIKNGPMDFQVREPVSPLFGGMSATNQMIEFQIAQEYTGQQRHVCYLLPSFKEILDFRTYCQEERDTVADIVSGKTFSRSNCGMAAVANTGNDLNWTGHDLAAANFYGFGRLSFDMSLSSEKIAKEWIVQTFGSIEKIVKNISQILLNSWETYEKYTSPLGIGWMVNPGHHYGPNVDGYEYDRWGTYHRADHKGLGVDRSSAGTGYSTQYHEYNARLYESKENCPEELLLFFHYVEYSYRLKSKKTLIQHIYDTHFEGVDEVETMLELFEEVKGDMDTDVYNRIAARLKEQLLHSKEWRDIVCSYFYRKSAVPDEKNREIY